LNQRQSDNAYARDGIQGEAEKYGFIHVPKKALPSLPFEPKESLTARIENDALVIRKA